MKLGLISGLLVILVVLGLSSGALADTRPSPGPWPESALMVDSGDL